VKSYTEWVVELPFDEFMALADQVREDLGMSPFDTILIDVNAARRFSEVLQTEYEKQCQLESSIANEVRTMSTLDGLARGVTPFESASTVTEMKSSKSLKNGSRVNQN
jgi:regulatory protein YycH of two-component signal transduction system YycFG